MDPDEEQVDPKDKNRSSREFQAIFEAMTEELKNNPPSNLEFASESEQVVQCARDLNHAGACDGAGDTRHTKVFDRIRSSDISQPVPPTDSGEGNASANYKTDINQVSFTSDCQNNVKTSESESLKSTIGLENLKLAATEHETNAGKRTSSLSKESDVPAYAKLTVAESTIKEIESRCQKDLAQELKQLGNDAFKRKDYANAINYYCKAIKCNPEDPILYANRAQAYIYIRLYLKAIADCDIALSFDPTYVKAIFRRAQARIRNMDLVAGRTDLILSSKLDPSNKEVQRMLVEVNTQIQHLADKAAAEAAAKAQPKPPRKKQQTPPPFLECVPVPTWVEPEKPIRILQRPKATRIDASYTCTVPEIGARKEPVPEFPKVILPIVKPPEKQSKRPLIGIHVKVVGNEEQIMAKAEAEAAEAAEIARLEEERKESEALERERVLNSEIPKVPKTTAQFDLDWKSLVDYPERAALYLKQMTADDFNIFKLASIDYHVVAEIIDVLVWEFMRRDWDYNQQLEGLARIGRLSTLILMFEEKDSCALRKLLYECGNKDLQDYYKATFNVGPL